MNIYTDKRIVMTLDAGGTNFVFSAIQGGNEIVNPIRFPSNANNLEDCLKNIVTGFKEVKAQLSEPPVAISFAFPGPADYEYGIIGDLGNLPAFRGGVALGPMLHEIFQIPVFINNDGDLFTYGEAIGGLLPEVNDKLKKAGSSKQFKVLFGITLGTGFGGGIVRNGELFIGDNGSSGEIWVTRNKLYNNCFAEEGASIRAIKRVYAKNSSIKAIDDLSPLDIYDIALGNKPGDKQAAMKAFDEMGEIVGDALANAITLIDGLIVIGGGLSGAASLFMPQIITEMNGKIENMSSEKINRLDLKAFNLEKTNEFEEFLKGKQQLITIPRTNKQITYDPLKRIGVGLSRLGTSKAVSVGAYAFALNSLDKVIN